MTFVHLDERFLKILFFDFNATDTLKECKITLPTWNISKNIEETKCINDFWTMDWLNITAVFLIGVQIFLSLLIFFYLDTKRILELQKKRIKTFKEKFFKR